MKMRTNRLTVLAAGLLSVGLLAGCEGFSDSALDDNPGGGGGGSGSRTFTQKDRLSRPVVNEVFATVSANRHKINNEISPTQDPSQLRNDIINFMKNTAGRSDAITNVVATVLIPDVMKANLNEAGPAAYLGAETNGATGGKFGGRKLTDDVVDISLGVVFGNTVSSLGLAPDDGKAIASLTTDNVGPEGKHFIGTFPYLGAPQ